MASSQGAALPAATLILRALTLILLAASLAVIARAKIYDPDDDVADPPYVLSVAVIGCAYTLLVIPFVAINVARRKMVGGSEAGTMFLIFADVVFSVIISTGAAAGLGLAVELQRYHEKYLDSDEKKFLHSVDASCGLLLLATVYMEIIIMISVYSLTK